MSEDVRGTVEPVLVSIYDQFRASKQRGRDDAAAVDVAATSPLRGGAVFLVGAPRSGTTWLQQLLALHPSIATGGETHVFCEGVATLFANHDGADDYSGLSGWVTRTELLALVRPLVDGILTTLRDAVRPDATHVLDKTPNHVPYARLLAATYPDASFVHIIRDGRDVATSARKLTAAGLWPGRGGYSDHAVNARRWRDAVGDCRTHLSGLRYVEVRYEDLLAEPARELARIYDVVGVPHDEEFLRRSIEFAAVPVNVRPSDARVAAQKYQLSVDAEREIFLAAGDLLVELGYVTADHVDAVVGAWTPRRAVGEATALSRKATDRARRTANARWGREARLAVRRGRVRDVAQALTTAVQAGDVAAVQRLLPPDLVLVDRGEPARDVADAARRLVAAATGSRPLVVEADSAAALVRWADDAGGTQLHRMTVDGTRLRRIEISAG